MKGMTVSRTQAQRLSTSETSQMALPSFNTDVSKVWTGIGLTPEQGNWLSSLQDDKGNPLFQMSENREMIYSAAAWIKQNGFDQISRYLQANHGMSAKNLIFESPISKSTRDRHEQEIDSSVFRPKEASGIYKCEKCSSDKVKVLPVQTRGADEPFTIFANCTSCGYHWDE